MQNQLFKDLVVVELASVLAGPAVGMFFAELGAKVHKIENKKQGGDVTRTWKTSQELAEGTAAYYYAINYHKTSHFLDLMDPSDLEECYKLFAKADIVVTNFNELKAKKLGVSYQQISSRFPGIIYSQILGFASNPTRLAYDVILQAESGFLSMTGLSETELCKMPVALIDVLAAHQLKEAVLCALIHKMKTGEGSWVSTSLEESAIASLANQATNYLMVNQIAKPMGTKHPNIAPYGDIFETKDGRFITLAVGSDSQFKALAILIENPTLANNLFFQTNADRVKNRGELIAILKKSIILYDSIELLENALKLKVPIGLVKNIQDVFESKIGKTMILEEATENVLTKRAKSVSFHFKTYTESNQK